MGTSLLERLSISGGRPLLALALSAAVGAFAPGEASAEVFTSAKTLPSGDVMLGLEPQVTPSSGPFYELFLHAGVGMTRSSDFRLELGLPIHPDRAMYFGGEVQLAILNDSDGAPGISMTLGGHGHGWERFGLDASLILSNDFGRFEPLIAVDSDLEFRGDQMAPAVHVVPGLMVDVSKVTRFVCELGIGVYGDAPTYVSAGFQFLI